MENRDTVVLWFADLDKSAITIAGGKGANLGELSQIGLPVPAGFVITTAAYKRFVAANDLQERIVALANQPERDNPAGYEAISAQIRDLFIAGAMPDELTAAIHTAYDQLAGESRTAVAVRSSATAEDLPSASFAGQQDTYLNINGPETLLQAVKRCWASLWTARAMVYRARQEIDPTSVALAVVVQQMAQADAAGILFTANPVNGQRGQAVIDATWGLGEAIVSGQVTPDQWVFDKAKGTVISCTTADKSVMTVRTDRGTEEQFVPVAKRKQPAINLKIATDLVRYGNQIEQHYQMPMDIEWAVVAGEIAILQARPITALPEPVADPPTEWPVPRKGAQFVRGSITEQMPDPLSPLFATLGPAEMTKSLGNLYQELLGKPLDGMGFTIINGYVYLFMETNPETMLPLLGAVLKLGDLFRIGLTLWSQEFRPRYLKSIATWQTKTLQAWAASELLEGTRELLYRGTELYTGVQAVIPLAAMSEVSFSEYYNRLVKRPGDPPAQTFLLGFDSQPIRGEKSLYDIAMWSRGQGALAEMLVRTPAEKLAEMLYMEQPPNSPGNEGLTDELWQTWRDRVLHHLDEFGHSIYNMDFVNAVPADAPAPILEILKFYVQGEGTNPYARQQDMAEKRQQATQRTLARLDPIRASIFGKLLAWAQRAAPVREDALADVGLGWPLLRQLLLELGRRLVDAGAISQPNEVFWLEKSELAHVAAALDSGETHMDSFAEAIAERKMVWRGQKRATPPQVLPENSFMTKIGLEQFLPAGSADQSGPVIKGIAVGSGQVTATARVLSGPEDFSQMKPGEVLVADITTPAWTPLFVLASAVVTDVGGPMSHSSIVAREYGIPAVLGTGIATKRIHSGQSIRVDGDAGTVTLLDEIDADAPVESAAPAKKSPLGKLALAGLAAGVVWWLVRRKRRNVRQ